jgi:hypothetical protein
LKKTEEPEGNVPSLEALDTAPLHAVGEVDDVTTSFLSYHPVRGGKGSLYLLCRTTKAKGKKCTTCHAQQTSAEISA